ncbi:MAG: hypothetical protein ABL886_04915 [Rhodoglobus sp.]
MPASPTAADILAKCAEAYASCRTYEDSGEVHSVIIRGPKSSERHTQRQRFRTAFERPDRFLFDYREMSIGPEEEWPGGLACSSDGRLRFWCSYEASVPPSDLDHALAALTGISCGTASFIPKLLGVGSARGPLPEASTSELLGEVSLEGLACYRIRGKRWADRTVDLWIECATGLVRRAVSSEEFNAESRRRMRETMVRHLEAMPEDDPHRAMMQLAMEDLGKQQSMDFATETTIAFQPFTDRPINPAVFEVSAPKA